MMNRRGQAIPLAGGPGLSGHPGALAIVILIVILIGAFIVFYNSDTLNAADAAKSAWTEPPVGFEDAKVFDSNFFKFFDYVFGKVPGHLIDWTENGFAAGIIVIGMCAMFLLMFGDIFSMFGSFSKPVSWVIAAVLTVIVANLKLIILVSSYALVFTALFGSLSVLFSVILVFGFFILFHFGSAGFRQWFMYRRIQDEGMKIIAGGAKAAGGLTVLKGVADAAKGGP